MIFLQFQVASSNFNLKSAKVTLCVNSLISLHTQETSKHTIDFFIIIFILIDAFDANAQNLNVAWNMKRIYLYFVLYVIYFLYLYFIVSFCLKIVAF